MNKTNSSIFIDLDAIASNVEILQSYCHTGVQQMAVVKADAYGHGAVKVAHQIKSQVGWFAVNDVYEAVELRESGITLPILVFGVPDRETAQLYRQHDITATISAFEHFEILPDGTEYHLNFDTGMSRLGFCPEQVGEVIRLKKQYNELICTGIYSHFATADELGSAKPKNQFDIFQRIRHRFEPQLITHMDNTAGVVQYPNAQFDVVRTGIGIYGYPPGDIQIPGLKPALHWSTNLIQINPIKKGETVSYGATWQAPADGFIGIIPVGYADGIPRGLSGNFNVTIDGEIFPVVGTVTMNYCMIFLGDVKQEIGAKVRLLNNHHTAQTWAEVMRTIPYEILTDIHPATPKRYTGN